MRTVSVRPTVTAAREFRTTHWSQVLAAGHEPGLGGRVAMEALCRDYWYPLYAYLRRTGHTPHDAQDFTQGFLASLIEKRKLTGVDPGRGKFRSFLLGTLKHYLSDERKKARAQRRGGDQHHVSIDADIAEARYRVELVDEATPEMLFERQWGLLVLERVIGRLQGKYEERGKARIFQALQPFLGGSAQPVTYSEIGAEMSMTEGAVKIAVHRLRQEFGHLLRDEIARTVADEAEIDGEIRQLIRVTSR